MAVRDVLAFQTKPGRLPDVVALVKEINSVAEKLNSPKARVFNTAVGGEAFLTRMVIFEHENMQAWAEANAKALADADYQALLPKIFGADAPWTPVSRSLMQEMPGI